MRKEKVLKNTVASAAALAVMGGMGFAFTANQAADAATKKAQTITTSKNTFETNDGHAAFGMGVNKSKLHGKITKPAGKAHGFNRGMRGDNWL